MSSSTVIEHNHAIITPLFHQLIEDTNQLKGAPNHPWYANQLIQHQLLRYLEYAPQDTIVEAMQALFYAFSHSGTREGLCQLCLGLFGHQSTVVIDDEANTVSITISNTNKAFDYAVTDDHHAVVDKDYSTVGTSLRVAVGSDPEHFFRQFLPAGVILKSLTIDN